MIGCQGGFERLLRSDDFDLAVGDDDLQDEDTQKSTTELRILLHLARYELPEPYQRCLVYATFAGRQLRGEASLA